MNKNVDILSCTNFRSSAMAMHFLVFSSLAILMSMYFRVIQKEFNRMSLNVTQSRPNMSKFASRTTISLEEKGGRK